MGATEKTIVLGVTGGIAAYKIAALASRLTQDGCDVHVIMTKNAQEFITPLTFETLTGNKCIIDTFARDFQWDVKHVSLAKRADIALIAPATANVIAKLAAGIADDMLTTTVLAMRCPVLISPSMNTAMYENPATQRNLETLRELGLHLVDPASGMLACRDIGKGRLPEPDVLYSHLMARLNAREQDLSGKRVLVTAGPTCEPVDAVRYITNHSTGKMGYAMAEAAASRGAAVTLVTGKTSLAVPAGVRAVDVVTAADMFEAVCRYAPESDLVIKAAAVADFTPAETAAGKMKKDGQVTRNLPLKRTRDILAYLGEQKQPGQLLCGFSMETENLVENSTQKLMRKNADMICANNLTETGAGFGTDTNVLTLITREGARPLPVMSKLDAAHAILDQLRSMGG